MKPSISKRIIITLCIFLLVCQLINGQRSRKKKGRRNRFSVFQSILGTPEKVVCNKETEKRLDQTTAQMTDHKFPENAKELRKFCDRGLKSAGLIMGYVQYCLSDFIQRSIAIVMYPITSTIESVCKPGRPGRKAKEVIVASKCGNAARPGLSRCYHEFAEKELAISTVKEKKKKVPMLCCSINSIIDCFTREIEAEKNCTQATIDFMNTYTVDLFGDIRAFVCRGYNDANDIRCIRVTNEIPELDFEGRERPKSIVSPLISIVRNLGEDDI